MLERMTHSLSARLLLLFIGGGAVLLLLVGALIGKGFAGHVRTGIKPFAAHYVSLLEQEIGSPPTPAAARTAVKGTPVHVHGFGPGNQWSTADFVPDKHDLETLFPGGATDGAAVDGIRVRSHGDQLFLHNRIGDYDLYFQIDQPRQLVSGNTYGLTILLSIFGILLLIYYATKRLFRPIEDIQHGIKLIGSGPAPASHQQTPGRPARRSRQRSEFHGR